MPSQKYNLISVIFWSCIAMLAGVFLSAGIFSAVRVLYRDAFALTEMFAPVVSKKTVDKSVPGKEVAAAKDVSKTAIIPARGKAIRVDLENGNVALYEDSQFLKSFSAVAIPDEFSPWRIPQGAYAVKALKAEHYSPLAGASFPDAILFGDNGLIHSEKKDVERNAAAGGALRGQSEDAGIVLAAAEAAKIFDFADGATKVIILNEVPESRAISYDEALREESIALSRTVPRISARAALAADLDTGEIFFEKLPNLALPIASISKLFTAVVAEELFPPGKIVRISPRALATYGGSGELSIGDTFSVRELLYPLLIESSNDVAEAFAETAGREQFIAAMNALARKLGLSHSSFKDPSGLSFGNTSTARDLFLFAQFLLSAEGDSSGGKEHADVLTISKTPTFKAPANELRTWARTWRSNNEFVRDGNPYLIGTKNGYTDEASQTTLSLFALPISETKKRRVAVILLGSHNREGDALALLKESSGGTLYKKSGFASIFRKKAENYAREKEKQSPEFRLAFIRVPKMIGVSENASKILENFLYLKSYDAVVADVEGIFSDTGYNIAGDTAVRAPGEILSEFLAIGVDVINVANAHAGDWGRSAFGDNVRMLEEKSFLVSGGGTGAADRWKVPVIESGGVRVGFFDISDAGPDWLSEEEYLPSIFSAKDPLLSSVIRESARNVDHLIVSIMSDDARNDAVARREALARATIDTGARVAIVISSIGEPYQETYKEGVIFYGPRSFTPLEVVFDKKEVIRIESSPTEEK